MKPNQPGYQNLCWNKDHMFLVAYNKLVLGKIAYSDKDAEYIFESEISLEPNDIEDFFNLMVKATLVLTGENIDPGKFETSGKYNLLVKVHNLVITIEKEKDDKITDVVEVSLEDIKVFFDSLQRALPIFLTLRPYEADCFEHFFIAVNKIRASWESLTEEESHEKVLQILKDKDNYSVLSAGNMVIKTIVEKTCDLMPLKSLHEHNLMKQFMQNNMKYLYLYYYSKFKST